MKNAGPTCRYADGESSRPRDVKIGSQGNSLLITGKDDPAFRVLWPYDGVRVIEAWQKTCPGIVGTAKYPDARLYIGNKNLFLKLTARLPRRRRSAYIVPARWYALPALLAFSIVFVWGAKPVFFHSTHFLASLIPPAWEAPLGDLTLEALGKETPFCGDEPARSALIKITRHLAEKNHLAQVTDLRIIQSPVPNAMTLPGGTILVTTGLLKKVHAEDEIAGTLAHEMGHIASRHAMQSAIQSLGMAAIFSSAGDASGLANAASYLGKMSYSRDMEHEADALGVQYLRKAGYDPRALGRALTHIEGSFKKKDKSQEKSQAETASALTEFLLSHPRTENRLLVIDEKTLPKTFSSVLNAKELEALATACP